MSVRVAPSPLESEVRRLLSASRGASDGLAFTIFATDALLYISLIAGAVLLPAIGIRVACGFAAGVVTLRLASIAHDAGHRCFVSSRRWNKFIGRVAFLPALQPLATWEVAHNFIHHSWAGIRGKDYVWIPFSPEQYRAMTARRKLLERLYRSAVGPGFYYAVELWWNRVLIPSLDWSSIPRKAQRYDIILAAGFLFMWITAAAGWGGWRGVLTGVVVPVVTWFWLFGLTLYLQHTNPRTQFFQSQEEKNHFARQLANSTHVIFPAGLNRFLHGIFEHSAHHLDVSIPFYRLPPAQAALNKASGQNVVERWSVGRYLETVRTCKLYDYNLHLWLGFDGRPHRATQGEAPQLTGNIHAQSSTQQ